MFVRKIAALAVLFALAMPVLSHATPVVERAPAAAKHKKGKARKAKAAKKKKAKHAAKAKAKSKRASHAPKHETPAASGDISHTPPEMKDDLPPPSAESTTEQ